MAGTMASKRTYWATCILVILVSQACDAFYLPGSYMHTYSNNEIIVAKVNSLTSIETELPFSYYSLPYCKPLKGIKKSAENLGELLMGDQIDNSPYRFRMNMNESVFLCTTSPLSEHEVKLLKQRTRDLYQVNMILDNLPAMRYAQQNGIKIQWTGFPVGYSPQNSNEDYIINHLKFRVLVHEYEGTGGEIIGTGEEGMGVFSETDKKKASGYEIVGFEVVPCSVKYDPEVMAKLHMYDSFTPVNCPLELEKSQIIKEQERVSFTYEAEFVKSDIRWSSRWDAYLKMEGARIHWFSILNSLMVIYVILVIFLRTVRRDLTRYEELDKEAQAQMNEKLSGWKLVVGDVFREPNYSKLLCVMIGDGVQILGTALVTIVFAALGFMSPASREMLLTGMIILYLFLGIGAGYVGIRLWRTIKGTPEGWRSVSWAIACFFPGIVFVILTGLNFLLWGSKSTGAIPISLYFILLALWFCISVPLTLLGGFFGTRAEPISYPVRTNQIPREIPARKYPSWLLVLGAGTLPFGTLFIELFFILSSIWLGRFYYVFGFLLVVLVLLVVVCAEVSVVLTYMYLCVEDWQWWWKAFYASGSVSLYVFLYSINYLVFDLQSLSGPVSAMLYLGYSLIMAIAIMLAMGTVGFATSFYFVHYLSSSVAQKLEQLEMVMGTADEISHLTTDTVHYNPSDLSCWLESMLSELNVDNSSSAAALHGGAICNKTESGGEIGNKRMKKTTEEVAWPIVLVDSQETGVRLVHTLMACAETVQQENFKLADALVKHIGVLAVSQAGAMRKVATYFAEALARRIYKIYPHDTLEVSYSGILETHFYETCPYLKFAHFTANQAILEAFSGSPRVHVIDFSLKQGMQWPALMQALTLRPGGPPEFWLTGIGPPPPDNTDALQQVGWKLAQLAETIGVRFHFRGFVANSLADIEPSMLDIDGLNKEEVESVAINSVFELHKLFSRPGAGEKVLGMIRAMKPKIVTLVEQEANHNGPVFMDRFNEALHYYSTMFDSLESSGLTQCTSDQDVLMSEVYLGRQICNVVACEGAERVERHETLGQWRTRMGSAGFDPVHLGSNAFKQASMLLALFSCGDGYRVHENGGCLLLGWHTRPLIASSQPPLGNSLSLTEAGPVAGLCNLKNEIQCGEESAVETILYIYIYIYVCMLCNPMFRRDEQMKIGQLHVHVY